MVTYLTDYPLDVCNSACRQYMNHVDWDWAYQEAHTNHVAYFDVSDAMSIFSHLELDEEYALFCYLSHEYHGLWGRVAAVKKSETVKPQNVDPTGKLGGLFGPSFELPDSAAPPMEAIYNDGTPHGYFEALLAKEFFSALPYECFEQIHWDKCIVRYPERFFADWNIYERIPDWRPRMITTRHNYVIISMCWRHFENGIGASDGCDTIRLSQHHFNEGLKWHHFAEGQAKRHTMYKAQIDDDKRYGEGRRCCVASERSITIAEQKDWRTLSMQRERSIDPSDYAVHL